MDGEWVCSVRIGSFCFDSQRLGRQVSWRSKEGQEDMEKNDG